MPKICAGSTDLYDVVSVRVAEVPGPDLSAHVPAVEGAGRELDTATVEHQGGHRGEREPLEAEFSEPGMSVER